MANIVPGALWHPVDVGNRAARRKGRGLIGHIAVTNSTLLLPGPLASRPSDWHFFLPKQPYSTGERFAQLIDLDVQCWSSADANPTCAAFESEGGVGADVNGLWTANQVESAAVILAHLHNTEGTPLQDMVNSLSTSRGFGVHRYGIDPYRVAGGEKWSSVYAKACPGDARVKQVAAVVARAQQIVNGEDMPLTQADANLVAQAVITAALQSKNDPRGAWGLQDRLPAVDKGVSDLYAQILGTGPGTLNGDLRADLAAKAQQLQAVLDGLGKVQTPTVDAKALAAALVADTAAVATLADALAAAIAKRLGNG